MRVIFCAGLALLLAACEGTSETGSASGEEGGKAEGEILGGTISDDMLPLAELKSQSPPRAVAPTPGATGTTGAPAQEEGSQAEAAEPSGQTDGQPEAQTEPEPETEPDPAPEPR